MVTGNSINAGALSVKEVAGADRGGKWAMKAYKTPVTLAIPTHLSNWERKATDPNSITAEALRKKGVPPPTRYID